MFGFGKKNKPQVKIIRGRFDAAQSTRDNIKHWSAAEFLSADTEASPDVRRTLRIRARYEVANNSYAKGIVQTLANDASGRLDHQTYYRSIKVDQAFMEQVILERVFEAWLREFCLVHKLKMTETPHLWMWDGTEHVDPAKEANAQAMRLQNLTTTLATEYAKQGKDWEAELHQIARDSGTSRGLWMRYTHL